MAFSIKIFGKKSPLPLEPVAEEGLSYEEAVAVAAAAPHDLQPFYDPSIVLKGSDTPIFNAKRALYVLAGNESTDDERSSFFKSSENFIAEDALMRIATPHFKVSAAWNSSINRRVLGDWLPQTLEKLESQLKERDC